MLFYSQEQYNEYQNEMYRGRATISDACREYALNAGADNPDQAWILTDWDTWQANPFYQGPAVPHPEFGDDYGPCDVPADLVDYAAPAPTVSNDDIPF